MMQQGGMKEMFIPSHMMRQGGMKWCGIGLPLHGGKCMAQANIMACLKQSVAVAIAGGGG